MSSTNRVGVIGRIWAPSALSWACYYFLCSLLSAFFLISSYAQDQIPGNADERVALAASINGPGALAFDRDGNLFITEHSGFRVRRVDRKTGIISTIAGNGKRCCFEDGKPAISTALGYPIALAVDRYGNLYIATISARILRVDAKTGLIGTVVRQSQGFHGPDAGTAPSLPDSEQIQALATNPADQKDSIYAVGYLRRIYKLSGDGITTFAPQDNGESGVPDFDWPMGMAFDASGSVFVADYGSCRIRRVDAISKLVSTISGTGECKSTGDGGPAGLAAVDHPNAITVGGDGTVYFSSNSPSSCIRRIDGRTGIICSIPGTCEMKPGKVGPPSGLAVDSEGNVYFSLWGSNLVRKVDVANGAVSTVAGNGLPERRDFRD